MLFMKVSMVMLWIVVICLAIALYAVSRYVGEFLKAQKDGVVPIPSGPSLGSSAESMLSASVDSSASADSITAILFVSTSCQGCSDVVRGMLENRSRLNFEHTLAFVENSDPHSVIFDGLSEVGLRVTSFAPGTFAGQWEIKQVPTLMVLDRASRIGGLYYGTIDAVLKYCSKHKERDRSA